jgi:hypothetical protein
LWAVPCVSVLLRNRSPPLRRSRPSRSPVSCFVSTNLLPALRARSPLHGAGGEPSGPPRSKRRTARRRAWNLAPGPRRLGLARGIDRVQSEVRISAHGGRDGRERARRPARLPARALHERTWRGQDSNLRRQSQSVYSRSPLTTRTPRRASPAASRGRVPILVQARAFS